jgi:lysophospholipase L1-like esterase
MSNQWLLLTGFMAIALAVPSGHGGDTNTLPSPANGDRESLSSALPQIADRVSYLADLSDALYRRWPTNRTINIVCHGHSVPAGYFTTPVVDSLNAYPHQLLVGLKERFRFAVINVIVTAIGGETSPQGAERFEREVLCHRPDVICLDYGLNDRRVGLEGAESAWRAMITAALARGTRLILLTPTHDVLTRRSGDPQWAAELPKHAAQIRRLAEEYGLALADSDAAFQRYLQSGGHILDLLSHVNHPNQAGHALVTRELLRWFPAQ